jgi:Methyltransferase FkbM domain
VALDRAPGKQCIHVHPDLVGSSFYLEDEDGDVNGQPRTVRIDTLDSICESRDLEPPYILKIDVQGAELDVLAGGSAALERCEFVIIESSFFNFYGNESLVIDVLQTMAAAGFALYDVFGLSYRPLDGALAQSDLCFVKNEGPFRKQHFFATSEQRRALNTRLNRMNASVAR